jgi:hypothetical protein
MGSDRRKYQDKTASEVLMKLHEALKLTKEQIYEYWNKYNEWKINGLTEYNTYMFLTSSRDLRLTFYFAALAMNILNKDIIEGIGIDKEKR